MVEGNGGNSPDYSRSLHSRCSQQTQHPRAHYTGKLFRKRNLQILLLVGIDRSSLANLRITRDGSGVERDARMIRPYDK